MGNSGAVGTASVVTPSQTMAVDPAKATSPVVGQPAEAPAKFAPKDETKVAPTGSADTQATFVEAAADPAAVTAPPTQPGVEEADPPSPTAYRRPAVEVVNLFNKNFGQHVLPPRSGEALAGQVLTKLGIDPRDEGAVKRLQKRVGAFPDGKFGPETWGRTIKYLEGKAKSGAHSQTAVEVLAILIKPAGLGGGEGGAPARKGRGHQAKQPDLAPVKTVEPPAEAPTVTPPAEAVPAVDPNAAKMADIEGRLIETSSTSMEKQIDDSWFWSSDTVAKNNINNPSSMAAMRPSTVAKSVGALMSGWTSGDDQKAIMVALKTQSNIGAGRLGATFNAMGKDFKDLAGELTDQQRKDLLTLAQTPDSGVTPDQLKALQDG